MSTHISTRTSFTGHDGDQLSARFELPVGDPSAYALFAHCFTCGKDIAAASRISRALARRGIAVLRFDFTGLGNSDGDFANTNFSSNVQDLVAAADYLREYHQAPALLIGHSLGGAAVLAAAGEIEEVKAVATIGAPADPEHVAHLFASKIGEIEQAGEAEVSLAGRKFRIKRQFVDDIRNQMQGERLAQLRKAALIFHSPQDELVGIDEARKIYQELKHPKSFVTLDGADHLLTRVEDADYVAGVLEAWSQRYLSTTEPSAEADGVVRVSETGTGKYTQLVTSGRHRWLADEPKSMGGDDEGPGPYELLLASLGACTAMTLRMYAEHKKLALEHVSVQLRHYRQHVTDCEGCDDAGKKLDHIDRDISISGDLTPEQRQRMLEIADRCPVHRTLHSEIRIKSDLVS